MLILPRRFREQKEPFELGYIIKVGAKFKVQVCRDGKVIREPFGDRFIPNLITNNGLDRLCQGVPVASGYTSGFYNWCRVGTGTTTPANTDTALVAQTQSASRNTTLSGQGSSYDTVNGAATHTQIFEFAAVGSATGLNEVGLSDQSNTGANLVTRALFPAQVNLNIGDNVRITYVMTESCPAIVTPITVSQSAINGFNPSGQLKVLGTFVNLFGQISSTGSAGGGTAAYYDLHFGGNGSPTLNSAPSTFPAVNVAPSCTSLGTGTFTPATYTAGTFTRNGSAVWTPSQPATTVTNVQGIMINGDGNVPSTGGLYLLLTALQTKANTNTLTITISLTVARA